MSKRIAEAAVKKRNAKTERCEVTIVRLSTKEIKSMSEDKPPVKVADKKKQQKKVAVTSTPVPVEDNTCPAPAKYNLRPKADKVKSVAPARKTKESNAVVKVKLPKPEVLWEQLKKSRTNTPKKNTIIISKMRTYSPWPSKLVGIKDEKALVYFFGTGEHGEVSVDEMINFEDGPILLKALSMKKLKHYHKGIREAEIHLGIPAERSLLNNIFSL